MGGSFGRDIADRIAYARDYRRGFEGICKQAVKPPLWLERWLLKNKSWAVPAGIGAAGGAGATALLGGGREGEGQTINYNMLQGPGQDAGAADPGASRESGGGGVTNVYNMNRPPARGAAGEAGDFTPQTGASGDSAIMDPLYAGRYSREISGHQPRNVEFTDYMGGQ